MKQQLKQIPKEYKQLIDGIASEQHQFRQINLKKTPSGSAILEKPRAEQRLIVLDMIKWLQSGGSEALGDKAPNTPRERAFAVVKTMFRSVPDVHREIHARQARVRAAVFDLLRRKLPFTHEDVINILAWSAEQENAYWAGPAQIIKVISNFAKENSVTPEIREYAGCIINNLESGYSFNYREAYRWATRLKTLVGLRDSQMPIVRGETWSDAATADIMALGPKEQAHWVEMIYHCATATSSKPSAKWGKMAGVLLEQIGFETYKNLALKWFLLVDKPRIQTIKTWSEWQPNPNLLIDDTNSTILRGLVWVCASQENAEITRSLGGLAISAYKKVPQKGPRCAKLANACVWVLGNIATMEAIGQLAILKLKINSRSAQNLIQSALYGAAQRQGLSPEEVEELAVPAYGMTEVGLLREQIGDFTAKLVVTGTTTTELRWIRPDDKPQKSIPKTVREQHNDRLKELRQAAKDIKKMLPAQRNRIDNLYLEQKEWDYPTWRQRYLEHPLVGILGRRLIWRFEDGAKEKAGIWQNDVIVANNGIHLDWLSDSTRVRLWHPIDETTEQVLAWRGWLVENEIQQPFKQAFREQYLLTDAERSTNIYSNRFAAHILRQHQFNALCSIRGWRNKLRLMVDDSYPPAFKMLPQLGLRAEFWIEGVGDNYGADTTDTGTYLYIATDQVRFYPINAPRHIAHASGGGYGPGYRRGQLAEPLPLAQIPPLAFSEIMRDVDLFVGVASIGNDPNWLDGGPDVRHQNYWVDYSFGSLSETAKTRKDVLDRLLPRLKIGKHCKLSGKFLIVNGTMRTYKIHLGSGNILMSPNDQYLCIVPAHAGGDKVFLPFEGDQTLAIILSKAFMLAEDTKINDPTIVRQIKQ